ncbi:hypothetical protein GCM10027164_16370 [Algoriphagus taiwanensis]
MPMLKEAQNSPIHEGNSHTIERNDGFQDKNEFSKISWELTLDPSSETLESVFTKLYDLATVTAEKYERIAFDQLDKTLARAGQTTISNFENPYESIIQAFEKIQFTLDENGNLDLSNHQIFVGSELLKKIRRMKVTSDQRKRMDLVLERKQKEAHAREANRKLVG